jgi:hypothetical protein
VGADPRDREVRLGAFEFLERATTVHGEVLAWRTVVTAAHLTA